MNAGWIGVDLDGTLAHYDGWVVHTSIGAPIAPMVARVKTWLDAGVDVRIFTARVAHECPPEVMEEIKGAIREWCYQNLGIILPITATKDMHCVAIWDDRCVRVITNKGVPCCGQEP